MNPSSAGANKDSEQQEEEEQLQESPDTLVDNSDSPTAALEAAAEAGGGDGGEEAAAEAEGMEDPMEEDAANPATVFCIRLKQPRSNLMHKMSVPELCRNFSAVAWCGKLNAVACASETCARIPRKDTEIQNICSLCSLCAHIDNLTVVNETFVFLVLIEYAFHFIHIGAACSNANPPFWIPIHIVIPERPTECAVFNVIADSPRDSVQFMEWSPTSCPRALLIANFHGRITIWTQPSQVHSFSIAHVLNIGISVFGQKETIVPLPFSFLLASSSSLPTNVLRVPCTGLPNLVRDASCWQREHEWRQDIAVVTKWLSGVSPYRWLSSKSANSANSKPSFEEKFLSQQPQAPAGWPNFLCVCSVFSSGSVQLHWAQWPPNQSSAASKWFCTSKGLLGAGPSGIMAADAIVTDGGALHVAGVPIVNPSTVVVWEVTPGPGNGFQATPKSSTGSGVPPSVNPPSWDGFAPLAAYLFSWQEYFLLEAKQGRKHTDQDYIDMVSLHCSPVSNFSAYVSPEAAAQSAATTTWGSGVTAVAFDPTRGGSVIAVVIVEGQYMSPYDPDEGPSITGWRVQRWESSLKPVVLHQIFGNPTSSFGGQAPMQTVWVTTVNKCIPPTNDYKIQQPAGAGPSSDVINTPDSSLEKTKRVCFDPFDLPSDVRTLALIDRTVLKIIRVLPPAVPSSQVKANSSIWERAIAERFWWSLLVGVDWWDAVGCTQSAAEDGIVSLNSVIAVLDADFHSLSSTQHRQQYGPSLDRIKCRLLEGTNAQEVRAMVLDMQARLLLDMLGKGIESALINPSALVSEPWQESGEKLSGIDPETMAVEPALVLSIQAYVDSVLDLASHFITRLRRYASFCRTLASHAYTSGTGGNRNMVASPPQNSASPASSQGGQGGTASSTGSTQMQAWVQGAIAKISSTADGVPNSTPNPISGASSFMPISINTGTFPGTPAVRLIGDCHFLHRLCQLLLFCFFFRRTQLPRFIGNTQRTSDTNTQKPQLGSSGKVEEINSMPTKLNAGMVRSEEVQTTRAGQAVPGAKGPEEGTASRSRLGFGNAGQGYTFEEVKVLFLILVDLCRRTATLPHPLPVSQVGSSNIQVRLHYIDGNYTVLPEVVEASLGPHMQLDILFSIAGFSSQNMPRPRGADAAGLLLRELELHPPAEEWHRRNMFGGPWSDLEDMGPADDPSKLSTSYDLLELNSVENSDNYYGANRLWPRKRRMSERDAAFGLNTSVGLGAYLGIMGSRRDVVTALWKTGLEGVWFKV
ncbi:hypothetical protein C3L33_06244, partial [Rhododendron williamsianum]